MGLLSGLGKAVRKISLKGVVKAAKGAVGTVAGGGLVAAAGGIGGKILKRVGRKNVKRAVLGAGAVGAGVGAAELLGAGGGGSGEGRRYRRINPGNTRALRRAIRRVEMGARIYSKYFQLKKGHIKGAPGVKVKTVRFRRAS